MIRLKEFSIALAIAAVLSIGARQAFAADASLACPPAAEGGVCVGDADCQQSCDAIFLPGSHDGVCSNNCCFCLAL